MGFTVTLYEAQRSQPATQPLRGSELYWSQRRQTPTFNISP